MPSVGTFRAQPLTRTFVVTQAPDAEGGETGAAYFTQANIDSWIADNTDSMTKVSDSLLIVTGSFYGTVHNLGSNGYFNVRRSLLDLGKEIIIGNTINSRLLVLRKVKDIENPDYTGVGGTIAYVVVESNYRSSNASPPDNSRFNVSVARC